MPAVKVKIAHQPQRKTVVIRRKQKWHEPTMYYDMPLHRAENYSAILLRAIRSRLGGAVFFTREDLIQLPEFKHVSTIYRYSMICTLVRFLSEPERAEIVSMNRTDLCLPGHVRHYKKQPLGERYFEIITSVVRQFRNAKFDVMDVVSGWKSDSDLTENNKRVAVRSAIRRLARDGTVVQEDFNYVNVKRGAKP